VADVFILKRWALSYFIRIFPFLSVREHKHSIIRVALLLRCRTAQVTSAQTARLCYKPASN
jgi:hypothetical protein